MGLDLGYKVDVAAILKISFVILAECAGGLS